MLLMVFFYLFYVERSIKTPLRVKAKKENVLNMKKLILLILGLLMTGITSIAVSTPADNSMLKASYVDLTATGSLASIEKDGIQASNVVLFAFADPKVTTGDWKFRMNMMKVVQKEKPGTLNFLSLGGEKARSLPDTDTVVKNICLQIFTQNNWFETMGLKNKIDGVDLDLEGAGFTSKQISELVEKFHNAGLKVSIAPQVFTSGGDIDPQNPENMIFTSGGGSGNNYLDAIKSGKVDYIMLQTYNTDGFKIGGFAENQVGFFKSVAEAVNNCPDITGDTKVLIGEPANQGAGGFTIFHPEGAGSYQYNQKEILTELKSDIPEAVKGKVAGIMMWSLNNDYMPAAYGDKFAKKGSFSSEIFGAPMPAPVYFILQLSNLGQQNAASVTLVVNKNYHALGQPNDRGGNNPISSGKNVVLGSEASSQEQAGVIHSTELDGFFKDGKTSFRAEQVLCNSYSSSSAPIGSPVKQVDIGAYTFEKGHSYNIMVNPDTMAGKISKMN